MIAFSRKFCWFANGRGHGHGRSGRMGNIYSVTSSTSNCKIETIVGDYIFELKDILQITSTKNQKLSKTMIDKSTKFFINLRNVLRNSNPHFVRLFIESNGFTSIVDLLKIFVERYSDNVTPTTRVLGCIKALTTSDDQFVFHMNLPTVTEYVARCLANENLKIKIVALEILSSICLIPNGHKHVLKTITDMRGVGVQHLRFERLIKELDDCLGRHRDDVRLKTEIMHLINSLLYCGQGQDSIVFRLHLRYEFIALGIQTIIPKLRDYGNQALNSHLDCFEMVKAADEDQMAKKFRNSKVDIGNPQAMLDSLQRRLLHSNAYPHFLSILRHLLLLPFMDNGTQYWMLCDRVLQHIVMQIEISSTADTLKNESKYYDPYTALSKIDVIELGKRLINEEEFKALGQRLAEIEAENSDYKAKLTKLHHENLKKSEELTDLRKMVHQLERNLELKPASSRATDSAYDDCLMPDAIGSEILKHDPEPSLKRLESGEHKYSVAECISAYEGKVADCKTSALSTPLAKATIPPPPPPFASAKRKKSIPNPKNPIFGYNWQKLPDDKIKGTIWSKLNSRRWYSLINLATVDRLFRAYEKGEIPHGDSRVKKSKTGKVASIICGRRAQNCEILLRRLKMSDEDIVKLIYSMDIRNQFDADLTKQLMDAIPPYEECHKIIKYKGNVDALLQPDRFIFKVCKIPRYLERLKCLHFQKTFKSISDDLLTYFDTISKALEEIRTSDCLSEILELILALGNYMNYTGVRGNANGFYLSSLKTITDTKSSVDGNMTLLHFLVQTITEQPGQKLLNVTKDLSHVCEASKIDSDGLEENVKTLSSGLSNIADEIKRQRFNPPTRQDDNFLAVMIEFHSEAFELFESLQSSYSNVKKEFKQLQHLFADESKKFEDFFGIFAQFLWSIEKATKDNQATNANGDTAEIKPDQTSQKSSNVVYMSPISSTST